MKSCIPRQQRLFTKLRAQGFVASRWQFTTSSTFSSSSPSSSSPSPNKPTLRRRLDVAIVGLPNAGKSQLLNALTQSPVSAVSRKRHTTRQGVLGARTVDDTQLLFLDTPGFLRLSQARKEGLQSMVSAAPAEMAGIDHTLLVVDAARALTLDVKETLAELMQQALLAQGRLESTDSDSDYDDDSGDSDRDDDEEEGDKAEIDLDVATENEQSRKAFSSQRLSVVLNKVDLVFPKPDLLEIAMELSDIAEGLIQFQCQSESPLSLERLDELAPTFFYVSARSQEGVDDVLHSLLEKATPCTSWDIDPEQSTSLTEEERVEEIVREKLYRCLHKEVPYNLGQRNLLFEMRNDSSTGKPGLLIHQEIIVRTKSHQELVFGGGGRTLERVRETAARDLESIFHCRVVLQLQVKLLNKSRQRNWSI